MTDEEFEKIFNENNCVIYGGVDEYGVRVALAVTYEQLKSIAECFYEAGKNDILLHLEQREG